MPLLIRSRSRSDSCWYSGAGAPGVRPERRGCVVWSVSVISSTRSRWSNRCATAGSPSCLYRDARHSAAFRSLETSGAAAVRFSRRGDACCSSEQRAGEGHQRPLRTGTRCAQQAAERTKAPAPWRSGAFAASCTRGSGPLVGRASRVPRPTRRPAPTERSVIREHVPPDANGDDHDDQAEREPELTAGQPATEGRTELGAWHRADRHDERGFVRDLVGDELPHDAHARGERRDGERAADRHANRHTDDGQQQRDEQERAAGADQSRADADASAHRRRERAAEAPRLTDGQGRRRRLDGQAHQRGGERQRHVADAGRDRWQRRLTTGHSTITTEMASSAALTGRVTKTLTSLAWATIDVRKYCSAIGPRMMPITSGGMGKSYRRMKKPRTPKSIVSQTSARSLRSANAPRKQKTTMKVLRIGGGTFISMAKER